MPKTMDHKLVLIDWVLGLYQSILQCINLNLSDNVVQFSILKPFCFNRNKIKMTIRITNTQCNTCLNNMY